MPEELAGILTEEIDEEILVKMPPWLRILREKYQEKLTCFREDSDVI